MDLQTTLAIRSKTVASPTKTQLDPKVLEKVQDFQSVLLNQFVAAMEPKEGFFGKGFGGSFFQSLFREEMAKQLAKTMDLGLAQQMLQAQLREEGGQSKKV
jgi:Rod binding domain-containing protein